MKDNDEIKEAVDIYDDVTTNMAEVNRAIRREQYFEDIASERDGGRKEGKKEAKKEIAKNMLDMNLDIDIIVKATGLTEEEINKLK